MNNDIAQGSNGAEGADRTDTVLESLFSHASARKRPPAEDEQAVREALRSEWTEITRRRRRRTYFAYGIAASLLLATVVSVNMLNRDVPALPPIQLASVEKQSGNIFVRRAGQPSSESRRLSKTTLYAGQVVSTAQAARLAVELRTGESLRIDEGTELVLTAESQIELIKGRIYVDSNQAGTSSGRVGALEIATFAGVIRHLGTQYMAGINDSAVEVSVREGKVSITTGKNESVATPGQQISVAQSGEASLSAIATHGVMWEWTELVTPEFNLDGRSAFDFIHWVGRETGHSVTFEDNIAERLARATELRGSIDLEPMRALDLILQTSDLEPSVEKGTIRIGKRAGT